MFMQPDPTINISLDYLVEFTDDGANPEDEAEIILLPPINNGSPAISSPAKPPERQPHAD